MTTEGAAPSGEKHRLAATKIAWIYSGWMNGRVCGELTDEIAAALRLVEAETRKDERERIAVMLDTLAKAVGAEGEAAAARHGADPWLTRKLAEYAASTVTTIAQSLRALASEGP